VTVLAVLAGALLFGAGIGVGYVVRSPSPNALEIFGETKTFGEARARLPHALAYLLGQQRSADGLTYGEWARTKFVRLCDGLDPGRVRFGVAEQGPFVGKGFRWDVLATYEGSLPTNCDAKLLLVNVGGLWSGTGEILSLSPSDDVGMTRIGVDASSNLVPPVEASESWWNLFRSGQNP
jgi:hypothetical protein